MMKLNYRKAIVIVHGKSELQICQYIKSNLRLPIEIVSDSNGGNSIQITSLNNILRNTIFKSKSSFLRNYLVEYDKKSKIINPKFKIFIIMDTDDCTQEQCDSYKSKKMFEGHWAYDYIFPVFNTKNLEDVLTKAKVPYTKTGDRRKKEYIKLFPTDPDYKKTDAVQLEEFYKNLKKISSSELTNLDEFVKFCIDSTDI